MDRRSKALTAWAKGLGMVLGLGTLMGGCASLPDVAPFVSASSQLQGAIGRAGSVTVAELKATGSTPKQAADLERDWKARNASVKAMVEYSSALQEATDAGNKGADAAEKLAGKVTGLATAVGLPAPGVAVEKLVKVAEFVYGQIAKAKVAKSLGPAVAAAQPAVSAIAGILADDIRDLRPTLDAANRLVVNHIKDRYRSETVFRTELEQLRDEAYDATFDVDEPDLVAAKEKLRVISELLAGTEPWYQAYQAELGAARKRAEQDRQLLDATARAIKGWAVAHASVAKAIAERRPVSVDGLVQASVEIQTLIQGAR